MRLLALLSAHSAWVLFAGGLLGLGAPALAADLRPLLPASVAGMLFLAMVRIPFADLHAALARVRVLAAACAWLLLACPLAVFGIAAGLGLAPGLVTALVLMAALPPLFSTPALALLLGLHPALALAVVVTTMLVGPFTLVAVAAGLLGLHLDLEPTVLMLRLAALVLGCLAAALLVRRLLGPARVVAARPLVDAALLALLLLFAVAVMDGVVARFRVEPAVVTLFAAASFAANLGLQALGALVLLPLGRLNALTLGFASGNRAMGLLLAVLPGNAASDTVLFFAVAQLPIYMLPALLAPAYRRLARL